MKRSILKQIVLNPFIFACSLLLAFISNHLFAFLGRNSDNFVFTIVFGFVFFIVFYLIMETVFCNIFQLKYWHYNFIALILPLLLLILGYYFCCKSSEAVSLAVQSEMFSISRTFPILILLYCCVGLLELLILVIENSIILIKVRASKHQKY